MIRSITIVAREPQRRAAWLVVPAILVLSTGLGYFGSQTIQLFVLAALIGICSIILLLNWPPMGFLALIVGTFLIRNGVNIGGAEIIITVIMLSLLIFVWLFDMFVRKHHITFVSSRPLFPLVAFCIAAVISFGFGQIPWFINVSSAPITHQLFALMMFILSAGVVFLIVNQIHDLNWLERITWVFLLGGTFIISGGISQSFGNKFYTIFPTATGSMLWIWMEAMSLSQALYNKKLQTGYRFLLLALAIAIFIVAYIRWQSWSSGWIPTSVVIAIILSFRFPRLIPAFMIIGLILVSGILPSVITSDQYSYDTRLEAWDIVMRNIIPVNPVFGVGPANYRYYTQLFPIRGFAVQFNSHNNYVDIIAQLGFVGLILFLWFFLEIGRLGLKLRKLVPQEGFSHAYTIGVLAGLVGTLITGMLGDWIIPFLYNVGINGFRSSIMGWILMGGLIVIEQIYLISENSRSP